MATALIKGLITEGTPASSIIATDPDEIKIILSSDIDAIFFELPAHAPYMEFDGDMDHVYLDDPVTYEPNPTFSDPIIARTGSIRYRANDTMAMQMLYEEGGENNGLNIYMRRRRSSEWTMSA